MSNNKTENNKTIGEISVYSNFFEIATYIIAIIGFVLGVVYGNIYHWVFMLTIWALTAFASLLFWAIYCIISNQEDTIAELKRINYNTVNKQD